MDIVQNYVASDICDRPNIGAAIRGRTSTVPPPPAAVFSFASPFLFFQA